MPKEQISSNDYSVKKVHRLQTLIHIRKLPVLPKYRNLSKIRNSKRQHADTYTFYVPKHIGTRSNGSSGSQYVVHQQDMLSDKTFGIAKMKDAVHILPPFIGRFPYLRFRMFLAHYGSSIQRNTRNRRNPFGHTFALVISAHPLLAGMQRNGNYDIHIAKELRNSQFRCHKTPHCLSQVLTAAIFQLMQYPAEITALMIKEVRGSAFQRNFPQNIRSTGLSAQR